MAQLRNEISMYAIHQLTIMSTLSMKKLKMIFNGYKPKRMGKKDKLRLKRKEGQEKHFVGWLRTGRRELKGNSDGSCRGPLGRSKNHPSGRVGHSGTAAVVLRDEHCKVLRTFAKRYEGECDSLEMELQGIKFTIKHGKIVQKQIQEQLQEQILLVAETDSGQAYDIFKQHIVDGNPLTSTQEHKFARVFRQIKMLGGGYALQHCFSQRNNAADELAKMAHTSLKDNNAAVMNDKGFGGATFLHKCQADADGAVYPIYVKPGKRPVEERTRILVPPEEERTRIMVPGDAAEANQVRQPTTTRRRRILPVRLSRGCIFKSRFAKLLH